MVTSSFASAPPLPFDASAFFAQSKDVCVVYDAARRFVYANTAASALFAFEPEALVGKSPRDLYGDRASSIEQCVERAFSRVEVVQVVHKIRGGSGEVVYLDTSYTPMRGADGSVSFIVAIGRDMTDTSARWRELEDTVARRTRDLTAMESRFDVLLRNLQIGLVIRGSRGEMRFVNRRALELLGLTEAQMHGRAPSEPGWTMLDESGKPLPPDQSPTARALSSGQSVSSTIIGIDRPKHADRVWLLANVMVQRDPAGAVEQYVVTLSDVTEAQKATRALAEREETFRVLTETITDVFWMTNANANVLVYVSPAYETVWGRPRSELYEQRFNFLDAIHPDDRPSVFEALPLQERGEYDVEYRVVRPDGTIRWVRDRAFPVKDASGQITRVVGLATDITEQRATSELIRRQADALRELSTPLVPIGQGVLAMPIVGVLDSARARQVLETLLEGIVAHAAEVVILDVTGVGVVDAQVASALVSATQAARLLGAEVLLTGLRPDVAHTIVGLGLDLGTIVTRSTLEMGIRWALSERKRGKNIHSRK
ncbi:PAS domain S-box protein [Polyangium sp. y55x31]|uniref:PAS domain S-box protein n=1 Tax=Polyangium sp. y55x31 TaxID=3042688 RepID=UPI00248226C5|nr:PAS domain S-box protein [Polyangium sp. y55x31]MDI1481864.1 PAS domain S-box protein [Polyangium sp. y55x31]